MTDAEFEDFADQMRLLVAEESYLWEVPGGSRDLMAEGQWKVHGPWRPEDCAAALRLWFDEGLIELLRRWPEDEPVPPGSAAEELASPDRWRFEEDGSTNISVVATEVGEGVPWEAWKDRLRVAMRHR